MRQSSIRMGAFHIILAVVFTEIASPHAKALTQGYFPETPMMWQTIERIGSEQLIGLLLLTGLLAALAIVGLRCFQTIASAVNQSREYESRVLTALHYNRVDEAINAVDSFPNSPVAAVVSASLGHAPSASFGKPANPAFHRALIAQTDRLKRSLWVLAAIGWSSTSVGLITSLMRDSYSYGPPVPLCIGLVIAVPAIWLYRGLSSQVDLLLFETDRMSLSIVDQIAEQLDATFDNDRALGHHMPREIRLPIPSQDSRPLR